MICATHIGYKVDPGIVISPPHPVVRYVGCQADNISRSGNIGITRYSGVVVKVGEDFVAGIYTAYVC